MDRTCPVRRIGLNGGLVLNLEDSNELVTSRPLRLSLPVLGTHPAEDVMIDLDDVPNHLPPLLNFSGSVCTQSSCDDDGTLHVELSNGHRITVDADEDFTTWELYGKHHGYMACLPHGRFRVVRHDLPEDHQVADLSAIAR
jgi:hypothetical protein